MSRTTRTLRRLTVSERDAATRTARTVLALADATGQAVTLTVPSSVHYSGRASGTVVGVAYPYGCYDGAAAARIVLDTAEGLALIAADAVMSWEPSQ